MVLQPRSRRIGHEQWKVADNVITIIRSTGLASKLIILEPQFGVHFLGVLRDVGRRSVLWWKGGVEDVPAEGLKSWKAEAQASVLTAIVASAMTRVVVVTCPSLTSS